MIVAKEQLLIVEQCGCLYFNNNNYSSYYTSDSYKNHVKAEELVNGRESRGRKSPFPKEVRELHPNAQCVLLTIVIIRVSVASGLVQKSFLEIMDPSH